MPTSRRPPSLRPLVNSLAAASRRPQIVSWPPQTNTLRQSSYHEDLVSPVSPAVISTASIWAPIPGIEVRVVDVAPSHPSPLPSAGSRRTRNLSTQYLLDNRVESNHKHAWVRKRHEHSPLFPFGLRSPILQCVVSGLVISASLTTLAVIASRAHINLSLEIVLALLLIFSGILFIHSLFRICLSRKKSAKLEEQRLQSQRSSHRRRRPRHLELRYSGPASSFDILPGDDSPFTPTTPMRVHLLRDEEAFINEKEEEEEENPSSGPLPTPPPPAYGLWKCSVRADPNLLHWERVYGTKSGCSAEATEMVQVESIAAVTVNATRRPPSYSSDQDVLELLDGDGDEGLAQTPGIEVVDSGWPLRNDNSAAEEARRMLRMDRLQM